jgi:tetratricopeptide (TPR) repeat protein
MEGTPGQGGGSGNQAEPGPGLVAAVTAALVILFVTTASLSRSYHEQRRQRAQENYRVGLSLAQEKRHQEAAHHFRTALAYDRENTEYRLALALALMEMERFTEAESRMKEVLARDPTNGLANRRMARLLVRQGRFDEAYGFYKRAIYGLWPENASGNRLQTRVELVEILAREGPARLLLPELLELQAEAPDDPEIRRFLARYFLQANAPDRAVTILRELAKGSREDEIWFMLGQAEYESANYGAAAAALQEALRLSKDNEAARQLLETVRLIVTLDPASRRVNVRERFRRSRMLLQEVTRLTEECIQGGKPSPEEELLVASGRKQARVRAGDQAEATDSNIQLSLSLWALKRTRCGEPPPEQEALARLMEKLAR